MTVDGFGHLLELAQASLEDPGLSAEDLAARAHLSRFHFDRLVSAAGGEPPGALRRRLLLERSAYQLFRHPGRRVLDVAVEAGYSSHESFTRAFTKAYGTSPVELRGRPPATFTDLELPGASGVHFQPPGGLRLPATVKESSMDIVLQLVDHHVDSLGTMIERAADLDDAQLDQVITLSVEGIDDDPTLRTLLNAMVTQEEHWLSALRGGDWPDESDTSVPGLRTRHVAAGRDFRDWVARAIEESTMADTFVDTTCDPPRTYTNGATIAHVVTFAAVRRTMAAGALESLGQGDATDLADPRPSIDSAASVRSAPAGSHPSRQDPSARA